MGRKWIIGTAVLLAALLGALVMAQMSADKAKQSVGKGEGKLNIIAWAGYVENGSSDKAYNWVTPFEKSTGCKVNVKVAGSSDEMVSLMNQGGYDLVTASGDASLRLIYGNKVQPINWGLIPSSKNLDKRLIDAPWYNVNGVRYGVPYQFGLNVLAYNTKLFKTAPDSWDVVFEETTLADGKSNKGRIQAYYGPIYIADAALYLMSTRPDLGIKDPYELTEAQYTEALNLLRGQRKLVQRYWNDANVQVQDFTNGGAVASTTWPFQVNTLQANKQAIASVVPKEGATGWADTTMMHADAKNPNCAYKWLEWSLNPKVQGDVAAWFGSNPVVPQGCTASKLLGAEGCTANGYKDFAKIRFWKTPIANCKTQAGKCVAYNRWVSDYIAIQGGK